MSQTEPSPTRRIRERYKERVAHINRLPELSMQAATLRETLTALKPRVAVVWIDQMIRGALWGRQTDMDVILALSWWMLSRSRDDEHYDFLREVYRIAHDHDLTAVLNLLRDPPPHHHMPEESNLPDVRLPIDREEITVGERRTLARGQDRDVLQRLVLDPSPVVIDALLENPKLEERDVLRITSRRPNKAPIMLKVVTKRRWYARPTVRKSLVLNPYNPTGVSLKLLPTLGIQVIRKVRYGSDVHPALSNVAEYLVDLRESRTFPWEV